MTDQYKTELELAIGAGIADGKSAAELSKVVRQYLNEPHKLFRRVRDKEGHLRLSKVAKAYHPGRGVYRSSYRNAVRLAATENNMAYRTADHLRWQQIPWVVGIEIKLSNNHNCRGVAPGAFYDICDELKGVYPKDFKFTGWHPPCRCFAVAKQADRKEFEEYQRRLLDGEDVSDYRFSGEVKVLPQNFRDWHSGNVERITRGKSQPYFLRDNEKYTKTVKTPGGNKQNQRKKSVEEIAAERHAVRDVADILRKWNNNREYHRLRTDVNYRDVEFDYNTGGLKASHIEHNFDRKRGVYEKSVQQIGYSHGDSVILEKEDHTKYKQRNTEGFYNNRLFEIAGAENGTPRNIRNALKHCASKPDAEIAIIYLPNGATAFEISAGSKAFNGLKGKRGQWRQFYEIIFMDDKGIKKRYRPKNSFDTKER